MVMCFSAHSYTKRKLVVSAARGQGLVAAASEVAVNAIDHASDVPQFPGFTHMVGQGADDPALQATLRGPDGAEHEVECVRHVSTN